MMQPMDPLSQLALCCGLRDRRKRYTLPRNYFYSPSTAHIDPANSWAIPNHYNPQPQPYILLTQPVIIAQNPTPNQTSTMTLIQNAQTAPSANTFPALSIYGTQATSSQQQALQPNIISSQYAIYNSSAALSTSMMTVPPANIYEAKQQNFLDRNPNKDPRSRSTLLPLAESQVIVQRPERRTLTSEIFRQLDLIEKQVDLTKDMNLLERHNIVIIRPLDPYSLMPYLTEATLRRYHSQFLMSDDYVIRFIEIIKRPGQTLGLYIRTVQFETQSGSGSREGLIITKIDTDSPIYNSQVLNVGDEILSINLVDIQGMSLDDVVVLMSIPKRLVLALRIPKERDRLLSFNLMQQQKMFAGATEQFEQQAVESDISAQLNSIRYNRNMEQNRSTSWISRPQNTQSSALPIYGSLRQGELRSDMMRRFQGQNYDPHPSYLSGATKAQSSLHLRETMVDPNQYAENYESEQPPRFGSAGLWTEQQKFDRPNPHTAPLNQLDSRLINRFNRDTASPKVQQSSHGVSGGADDGIPNFLASQQMDSFEQNETLSKIEKFSLTEVEQNSLREKSVASVPHTFPRRTLPIRPDSVPSPTSAIKQPVISNLRLGDTPEQSSYFSSSIDAINRELKELRRQRMALSNNDQNLEANQTEY